MIKYPLAKPHISFDDSRGVSRVLKSGILSLGPENKKFETGFAKRIGVKYACAVANGTAGLHLSMLAAGIGPGDEVITTPFSFVASANCILYVGARPIFVDIDPVTYNMDPIKIEEKITKKTKAILVVHVFGQSADMATILKMAKKYNLKVIEDACESIKATYKGKQVGTFGESAIFAFYPNKQITTGEGGMVVTNNSNIYKLCKSLSNQGRGGSERWLDHERLGYNYRLDEMSAALGVSQLKKLDFIIKKRQKVAGWYAKCLNDYSELIQAPQTADYNTHSWFVYVVKIKKQKINRKSIIEKLEKKGVAAKPYFPAIHLLSFYKKKFGFKKGDYPVTEELSNHSLALPFYSGLKKEDIQNICNSLIDILKKYAQ